MIDLSKGSKVDLGKLVQDAGGNTLDHITVALGWAPAEKATDLDASVVGLKADGTCAGEQWFVWYRNLTSPNGEITHQGDELTGATEGDDETIQVKLASIPEQIQALAFVITIHEAAERGQDFGKVSDTYVRIDDAATGSKLVQYNLAEAGAGKTAFVAARAHRENGGWVFEAVGEGLDGGMPAVLSRFGIA